MAPLGLPTTTAGPHTSVPGSADAEHFAKFPAWQISAVAYIVRFDRSVIANMGLPTALGLAAVCAIYFRSKKRAPAAQAGTFVVGLFMAATGQDPIAIIAAMLAVAATRVLNTPAPPPERQPAVSYVAVEGIPGAGKSTAVQMLGGKLESVRDWAPFLDWADPNIDPGASLARQIRILSDYFGEPSGTVTERSWLTCLAFSAAGPMADSDPRYIKAFMAVVKNALRAGALVLPQRLVFMECTVDECMQRIKARGQPGDSGITAEYLERLCTVHETMKLAAVEMNVECITLTGAAPPDAVKIACTIDDARPPRPSLSPDKIERVLASHFLDQTKQRVRRTKSE